MVVKSKSSYTFNFNDMKKFIIKIVVFIIPIILIFGFVELSNRKNNTFYAKKNHIEQHSDSIEVLILGSSQIWRSINPEFLSFPVAPLAHGGGSFNIDYLLFKKYISEFPKLKVVLLEASYHTFEDYRDKSWRKNHLFYIFYGINNYQGEVPLKERLLVTANPKQYIKRLWTSSIFPEFGEFNKFGFITSSSSSLEETHDSLNHLIVMHNSENLNYYKKNIRLLKEIAIICQEKNIEIVLFSPPKYYTYNKNNIIKKLERRNFIFNNYINNQGFYIWNYEKMYQYDKSIFYNHNHLNVSGAKLLTIELDLKLKQIIQTNKNNNLKKIE